MKQQLWSLVLCLCLSACASPPPPENPLFWQGPPTVVQMTIWVTQKGTTIPTQAVVRLSAAEQDMSLILVYGSTVGHCQLASTRASCTAAMPAMAPVLASVGDAVAQLMHSFALQGTDNAALPLVAPPHMQFSEQRLTEPAPLHTRSWPAQITVRDAARGITLQCTITEVSVE